MSNTDHNGGSTTVSSRAMMQAMASGALKQRSTGSGGERLMTIPARVPVVRTAATAKHARVRYRGGGYWEGTGAARRLGTGAIDLFLGGSAKLPTTDFVDVPKLWISPSQSTRFMRFLFLS